MNNNQKKGIALIAGGILCLFLLPIIFRIIAEMTHMWLGNYYLQYIIALVIAGFGIKTFITKDTGSEEEKSLSQTNQTPTTDATNSSATQTNKVVNVSLTGGIIGLLAASPQNALNNVILKENANGWRVIQVIPAESGNIFLAILRLLILVLTLFLYTTANGYYVIMERKN